jgi:Concanavalin A-like lectin/glucanases superfamily
MADPGGPLLHDIGSGTKFPLLNAAPGATPFTGPSSDGGSAQFNSLSHGGALSRNVFSLATSPWSIEMWVYPIDLGAATARMFQFLNGAASVGVDYLTSKKFQFFFSGFGGSPSVTSGATYNPALWHYIVCTYDHVTMRLYVNGAADGTNAQVVDPSDPYDILLAQTSTPVTTTVNMAELAFYTSVLTATQVSNHFNAADTVSQRPLYKGAGVASVYPVATGSPSVDLTTILNSVRKTY